MSIDFDGAVLIGAGAVGNAFLRRCVTSTPGYAANRRSQGRRRRQPEPVPLFHRGRRRAPQAEALANNAEADFPEVALTHHDGDFHEYVKQNGPQRTAIVTVDSRRVRRAIQAEVPDECSTASTTDIRAVVVHSHRQPTEEACLSCIYRHVLTSTHGKGPLPMARDQSGNGQESLISADAAALIAAANARIQPAAIEGMAYDSLFKQLCAEQALKSAEGKQVFAPSPSSAPCRRPAGGRDATRPGRRGRHQLLAGRSMGFAHREAPQQSPPHGGLRILLDPALCGHRRPTVEGTSGRGVRVDR